MKKLLLFTVFLFLSFSIFVMSISPVSLAEEFKVDSPFLITSAGQSSCYQLFQSIGKQFEIESEKTASYITGEDLDNINTLVIVAGINEESLKKAGVKDTDDELNRIQNLIEDAHRKEIKVITVYLGVYDNNQSTSLYFLDNMITKSHYAILLGKDSLIEGFEKIKEQHETPIYLAKDIMRAGEEFVNILADEEASLCAI